ncbi:unnamed protein product [Chrysodeixis includens]|uniref:Helitron helicase-like domain-containing protein n=1 Tax=Chrysodeixis includens TaxID=689277 RepID=A0A9N8PWT8_CHRIL|nr:unnamed protein product [Chrysodeixis includens]
MQFYAVRLMVRINNFNSRYYFKGLFNQFCVDMAAKMISERLNFMKKKKKLGAEEYIHLRDAMVNDTNVNASNVGQHVILPSSFTGSPRYMNEKSQVPCHLSGNLEDQISLFHLRVTPNGLK